MQPELDVTLFRFLVAMAIGALVGLERQARLEEDPRDEGGGPGGDGPPDPEGDLRAALAAGESSRIAIADAGADERAAAALGRGPRSRPRGEAGGDAADEPERWTPDFQQAAGFRTYTLISLSGALAATFASPSVFVVAFLMTGILIASSYMGSLRRQGDMGLTSEVAALAVFLLGGLCAQGDVAVAAAAAVAIVGLLSVKQRLHGFARRIQREDINAILKFALLTMVILPVMPEEPVQIGQYLPGVVAPDAAAEEVIEGIAGLDPAPSAPAVPPGRPPDTPWWAELTVHPRHIWYMVILISGISFAGYVLGQVVGTERGIILTGLVGGLVSSTAVSLTYAQRSRESPALSPQFAIGILLANALMPLRLLIILGLVAPALIEPLALPLIATALVGGAAALVIHLRRDGGGGRAEVKLKNPFAIGPALKFGLLFGVVLFAAQIVRILFGHAGLYALALVTGLTDVDAIGLAIANMVKQGEVLGFTGAITVTLAVVSNTLLKGGFVVFLGARRLRTMALVAFGVMLVAAGGGIALLWSLRAAFAG